MKGWPIAGIALLMITSGVTMGLLLPIHKEPVKLPESSLARESFTLGGKGSSWQVNDYTIIRTASSIYRGQGSLTYLGDPEEIEHSAYFGYSFFEQTGNGELHPVLANETTSPDGTVSILENVKQLGAIQGQPSSWELEETAEELGHSYMEMNWKDSQGILHTENIPLAVMEASSDMD
ncbi:hypothetical protein P9847_16425 [Paenibacillus chibensis]|uniref:DUF4944 domain-containing protein n=1 Tax=Paenibacillus chibensis TaxID=59846 RepID=A0ABU6PX13_9BACL|nr:hypothetical protein [Paenibacillus chibensis]